MRDQRDRNPSQMSRGGERAEEIHGGARQEDDEEQRVERTWKLGAVVHRRRLPARRAAGFFVEHLNVATNPLNSSVDEEVELERCGENEERDEEDASP